MTQENNIEESKLVALVISKPSSKGISIDLITPEARYMIIDGNIMGIVPLKSRGRDFRDHFSTLLNSYGDALFNLNSLTKSFTVQIYREDDN